MVCGCVGCGARLVADPDMAAQIQLVWRAGFDAVDKKESLGQGQGLEPTLSREACLATVLRVKPSHV